MNILIVDDVKLNLAKAKDTILQNHIECNIFLANSAKEALEIIDNEKIDIILLDIIMPEMSGLDLLEVLRNEKKYKYIFILMFTTLTDKKYLKKSFDLGANDYINKPIEPIEFVSRLKSAIKIKNYQNTLIETYNELIKNNKALKEANLKIQKSQRELINKEKLYSVGRFSAGIAHEMNTPLGYVTSNIATLNKYFNSLKSSIKPHEEIINNPKIKFILEDYDQLVEETNDGLGKISKIIKDIINFAKYDDKREYNYNKFSEMIKESLILLKYEIGEKNLGNIVNLELDLTNEDTIMCNSIEIEHVLVDIIKNSIYFINKKYKKEKGNIFIKTYVEDKYLCCEIKDDGIGIKEEHIGRVFEPFFTTKEINEGTGLAMSIAYDIIVNRHNGQIKIHSTFGQGATFIIKLPMAN